MISRQVQKWNKDKKEYEPYEYPDDWHISYYEEDMEETVDCAACGTPIKYGDGYTSKNIHTSMGFGYCVCESCYEKE